jgi:hypothetical protein
MSNKDNKIMSSLKSKTHEVEITASLNQDHKVVGIRGDGSATLMFDTSASELAKVLTAFASFSNRPIKLKMTGLPQDSQNAGRKKKSKTYY